MGDDGRQLTALRQQVEGCHDVARAHEPEEQSCRLRAVVEMQGNRRTPLDAAVVQKG